MGQNTGNAEKVIQQNDWGNLNVHISKNIKKDMAWGDVVSCATGAVEPIIFGKYIMPGTHVDLVGSYKPTMREADDELIKKANIYIDNEAAKKESGDIYIPIKNKIISEKNIKGILAALAKWKNKRPGF